MSTRLTIAALFAQSLTMPVNKKVAGADGKPVYELVGTVAVPYPTLADFGLDAKVTETDKDTGLPVYADPVDQLLFDAVLSQVKANARNKLESGSVQTKPGATIATSFEALTAESGNSGAALELRRNLVKDFAAWVPTLGKASTTNATLVGLVQSPAKMDVLDSATKGKVEAILTQFAEALSADKLSSYSPVLAGFVDRLAAEDALSDL